MDKWNWLPLRKPMDHYQFIWMRFLRKGMSRDKLTEENNLLVTIYTLAAR